MKYLPDLLIIAGSGFKSGKTSIACRLIEQFSDLQITAIRISPHFHSASPGLITIEEGPGFCIYEETNPQTTKDTSRMLRAGAEKVYLILVWDSDLSSVFGMVMARLPAGCPVICESQALRNYFEPGLFIIMSQEAENTRPDAQQLIEYPHLSISLEEAGSMKEIPVMFKNGEWLRES